MKKEYYYIIAGFLILLFILKKPIQKTMNKLTRGYRNNNFGNIVKTFDKNGKQTFWEGEIIGNDSRFKTFKTPAYGYRAIFVLLDSYLKKGRNTIEKIISVYAPSSENNTEAYITALENKTNLNRTEAVESSDFSKIIAAISEVENGIKPNEVHISEGENLYKNG